MDQESALKNRRPSIPLNKQLGVFLICLLVSALLWLITVFSKPYETQLSFAAVYLNLPTEKLIAGKLPDAVSVKVKGSGFALLGANFSSARDTLFIDAGGLRETGSELRSGGYFLLMNKQMESIADQLGSKIEVLEINPDTVKFIFDQKTKKIIEVKSAVSYSCAPQYHASGPVRIHPPMMVIKGPSMSLENIDQVTTESMQLNNLDKPVKKLVKLTLPGEKSGVEFPAEYAVVEIPVEKYTEVNLKLIPSFKNVPEGKRVKCFPSSVDLRIQIPLSRYGKFRESDFELTADVTAGDPGKTGRLKLQMTACPEWAIYPVMMPEKVEYILEQMK